MTPNISLMLTRLAGENVMVPGQPSSHTMKRSLPEPPGSIARGRWAAAQGAMAGMGLRPIHFDPAGQIAPAQIKEAEP